MFLNGLVIFLFVLGCIFLMVGVFLVVLGLKYLKDSTEKRKKPNSSIPQPLNTSVSTIPQTIDLGTSNNTPHSTLIQQLVQNSPIQSVRDPYLSDIINIGEIVVVVKSYNFSSLEPLKLLQVGDLLRMIDFRVEKQPTFTAHFIDKFNIVYPDIICMGILLNTYLEHDPTLGTMVIKFHENTDSNLDRVFPLNIISLEKTLLKHE